MDDYHEYPGGAIHGSTAFLQSLGIMILYGGCGIFLIAFDSVLFVQFHFSCPVLILLTESIIMLIIMECLRWVSILWIWKSFSSVIRWEKKHLFSSDQREKWNGIKIKSSKLCQQEKVEKMMKLTKNWCLIDFVTAWRLCDGSILSF